MSYHSEKVISSPHEPLLASKNAIPSLDDVARTRRREKQLFLITSLLLLTTWFTLGFDLERFVGKLTQSHGQHKYCRQVPALIPRHQTSQLQDMDAFLQSESFKNSSILRLSRAVQIPTESFDDLGPVGQDPRWNTMYDFADYLKETFPQTHQMLSLEKVNTHGLLYTWQGEDESLKPTLLMAHQDVVPVPNSTVDAWTHPPFSGYYDGEFVWGRGSSDCKNQLIGDLEAIEELINAGFRPRRTIILSFGFDEEISGPQGAGKLAPFILQRYGHDGVATIIDEGSGFDNAWDMKIALPGVGEKGYTDVSITVRMPGGHSSIPPDHTGIGVMSELISLIESDKYAPHLDNSNPYLQLLSCGVEYAPQFPHKIKKLLKARLRGADGESHSCRGGKKDHLAIEVAKSSPAVRYLMQTSIAADVISGGVKVNALPERTSAIINHRVNVGEYTSDVHRKITRLAKSITKKYNLTLHAFDSSKESPRSITLSTQGSPLEPAPVSPTSSDPNTPWAVLAGTVRNLYGEDIIVAPGIMTGNTDTKHYWNLTKHIFRFSPGFDGKTTGFGNIHTVDEKISVAAHVNLVRWTSLFVRNMDESSMN